MSSDDGDVELRDSIIEALEKNGTLAKLKAQLRASVFLAMEEQENDRGKSVLRNEEVQNLISTDKGRLCLELFMDFLACFKLEASASVLKMETGKIKDRSRQDLANQLGLSLTESEISGFTPLMEFLFEKCAIFNKRGMFEDSFFASPVANGARDASTDDFKPVDADNDDFFGHSPPFTLPDAASIASTVTQRPRFSALSDVSDTIGKRIAANEMGSDSVKPFASKVSDSGQKFNGFLSDLPEIPQKISSSPFPPLVLPKNDKSEVEVTNGKRIDLNKLLGNNDDSPRQSDTSDKSSNSNKKSSTKSEGTRRTAAAKPKTNQKRGSESADDDISEEIVEDLEVDDLLNSARSSQHNSF